MNPAILYLSGVEVKAKYNPTPVIIGGQIWDLKNLSTFTYRDGAAIPRTGAWVGATTGIWRYYNNDSNNGQIYGKLYNWYAMAGIYDSASLSNPLLRKNIAPEGWRVATESDWNRLSYYNGRDAVSGGLLKEFGTTNWTAPNTGAVSSPNLFKALPGGFKSGADGTFNGINTTGTWWAYDSNVVPGRNVVYNDDALLKTALSANIGRSIRLIKEDQTIPDFTVNSISNLTESTATSGGTFGNLSLTPSLSDKGICWSLFNFPNKVNDSFISAGSGTTPNPYSSNITGLIPGRTYYVRAYAVPSDGSETLYSTNTVTFTAQYSYILDTYGTSVHHAFSLRKLKSTYSGFCFRGARTIGGITVEVNVGFDSNFTISLDSPITTISGAGSTSATTLGQFAGSLGYTNPDAIPQLQTVSVVTWYDQSGNNKNVTNAVLGGRPFIVFLGDLLGINSYNRVALRFVKNSSQSLTRTDTTANINNMSSYFTGGIAPLATASQVGYSLSNTTANRFFFPNYTGTNITAGYNTLGQAIILNTGFTSDRKLYELISPTPGSTTLTEAWTNGVSKGTVATANAATTSIQIGTAGAAYFDGFINEVIGWQTNANRVEKETNINAYWQVY
jgi:uncharacterized protein (TIGR02145 family)